MVENPYLVLSPFVSSITTRFIKVNILLIIKKLRQYLRHFSAGTVIEIIGSMGFPESKMFLPQGYEMLIYQLKVKIKPHKPAEFLSSMHSILPTIRKEKGCIGVNVYRCAERQDTYILIGEWETRQAMEKHFHTQEFVVLLGAAKVLGKSFEMNISEVFQTGGFELAKRQTEKPEEDGVEAN
jgi:quinol monooxygenase YgiN